MLNKVKVANFYWKSTKSYTFKTKCTNSNV